MTFIIDFFIIMRREFRVQEILIEECFFFYVFIIKLLNVYIHMENRQSLLLIFFLNLLQRLYTAVFTFSYYLN